MKSFFRKIGRWFKKKFLMLISQRFRNKLMTLGKATKKLRLTKEVKTLIEIKVLKNEIAPKTLWFIYRTAIQKDVQQKALEFFLGHFHLSIDDIFDAAENVSLGENELLLTLWNKSLEIGVSDERLSDVIKSGPEIFQDLACNELLDRIKEKNKIRKSRAIEILIDITNRVPNRRISFWRIIETLEPPLADVQKLLDSDWVDSMPTLRKEIEQFARKIDKKERDENQRREKTTRNVMKIFNQLQKLE